MVLIPEKNDNDEDDDYVLSNFTLAALNEFLINQNKPENIRENDEIPTENWQLSQFWYTDETSMKLVEECISALNLKNTDKPKRIACISSPSLIRHFLKRQEFNDKNIDVRLFEFDSRFAQVYPEQFIPYDYKKPLNFPHEFRNAFDLIVVDPPFIAVECLVKIAQTIKLLSKNRKEHDEDTKIVLCTGSVIQDEAFRLLKVNITNFKPKHRNNLANDFSTFTNYEAVTL